MARIDVNKEEFSALDQADMLVAIALLERSKLATHQATGNRVGLDPDGPSTADLR